MVTNDTNSHSSMNRSNSNVQADTFTHMIDTNGQITGEWLEDQVAAAFRRWGYWTELKDTVYGLEVDVVGQRREPQQKPTDKVVVQCKHWTGKRITPKVIYRLCMVSFACRAMPVLCHTTELTDRAEQIAADWEVRVLTLEDLNRDSLPTPRLYPPTSSKDAIQSETGSERIDRPTVRETRGSVPGLFRDGFGTELSYVPEFVPIGEEQRYTSIEEIDPRIR